MKERAPSRFRFLKEVKLVYVIVTILILAIIVVRLALPGIVKNYVNKKLNELPGYTGHVDDIDIHLLRGAYVIKILLLKKKTDLEKYPFLQIRQADLSIEWSALFKGRLVGKVTLDQPVVNILTTESIAKEPSKDSWTKTVKALMPMTINKLQVNDGRFDYRDLDKQPNTDLHIEKMQLTALNLANVQKAADPLPSQVNLTGISIGNGKLKMDAKVNVLKDIPDFEMGMQLIGANLLSLNGFFEANAKMDVERGGIDIFSKLKLKDGEMNGYVKPFIKDLKVLDVKKDIKKKGGIIRVVKKAVVGLFAKVVTNPKTKKIATIIPIKGSVKDPKTSGWATFVGILKNAFVQAFHESLTNEIKFKEPAKSN
ncbi:protein of unknown function [Mucilaginibacter lappiensis]|uniref:AsmA-like C-terminal region n=1 Tax=Mucilaginibacter lappiensis TaxID=354630 RepID=A0ABR6PDL8_9SPHI|nr:DUF748 domain-containing protein [Mucilaginibacter lappiensis]MBB6107796.1 hypothetical protein [Mucilaginibacter lappiensis]SIP96864.1 protein of unknown function [Mucilaginibacter lappiensis]